MDRAQKREVLDFVHFVDPGAANSPMAQALHPSTGPDAEISWWRTGDEVAAPSGYKK